MDNGQWVRTTVRRCELASFVLDHESGGPVVHQRSLHCDSPPKLLLSESIRALVVHLHAHSGRAAGRVVVH